MYCFNDLYNAIEVGDSELVYKIISEQPSLLYEKDKYGFTVVHAIASTDNEEIVEHTLKRDIDVNIKNDEGITALHSVLYPETAQLLIDYGADVSIKDNKGNTPLHTKASDGEESFEVIEVLLNNGADKLIMNQWNKRPYDISKSRGDLANMKILK